MASRRGEYEDKASVRESMCLLRELQGSQRLNSGHSLFLENAMVKGVESARMRSALHVARGVRYVTYYVALCMKIACIYYSLIFSVNFSMCFI